MNEFVNKITSLDNIKQWEERDSVIKESVSQHSFKVSALCIYFLEKVFPNSLPSGFTDFKLNCVEYAILHDFDESIIKRDISHVVKYNDFNGVDIRKTLENFVEHSLNKMNLGFLFQRLSDPDVKLFVKMCDWIAIYTFIVRNRAMGVKVFKEEAEYCKKNIAIKSMEVEDMLLKRFNKQLQCPMCNMSEIVTKLIK